MKTIAAQKLGITLAGVLALLALPARVHAAAIAYTVTDLGTLGGTQSFGFGINVSGQVVGASDITGNSARHAVRWTGTTPTDLGTIGVASAATAINASGQVAGFSWLSGSVPTRHAVRWTGTTAEDLGTQGGTGTNSYSTGINASGQVSGGAQGGIGNSGPYHAGVWTGTSFNDLGLGAANGINDSGQVVGGASFSGSTHAVRWTGNTPTDLGTLGGTNSIGYGINASGQVAGWSNTTGNGNIHAVRWTGTTATDLDTLGSYQSEAFGINNAGDVTGVYYTSSGSGAAAFLYTAGTMYDLQSLLVPGSGVSGLTVEQGASASINDLGQIAATGTINGQTRALRLDPVVPEPSTALLLIGSGVPLLLRRRHGAALSTRTQTQK